MPLVWQTPDLRAAEKGLVHFALFEALLAKCDATEALQSQPQEPACSTMGALIVCYTNFGGSLSYL